jgi:outer membrane receptor protein involved in Fe transport
MASVFFKGLIAACALVTFTQAQTDTGTKVPVQPGLKNQDSLKVLDLMVITGSKTPQSPGNVTQKIDVVSAKEIETTISGNRNVCEEIQKLPGAAVTVLSRNDANWGTYGGIGPTSCTYMLQGLPIDAFIDPMSLDLNAVDHIEVQRGPASVLYPNYLSQDFAGNQSPFAGTVNLILKEKIDQPETRLSTSYGSYNTLNGQVFHQNRIGRLNFFGGSTYEMSDYTDYGDTSGSWLNMKNSPQYKKTKLYGGLTLFMDENEKQKLTIFGQETWHTGDAGRVYRGFDNNYGTLNAGYDVDFGKGLRLQSHLGLRSYDRTWQESNFGVIDTLKSNNGVNQMIVPADISFSWSHWKGSLLTVGADYQEATYGTWSDPLLGYQTYGNKSSAMQGGAYVQEELRPIDKLTVRGGWRYAYIKDLIELVNGGSPGDTCVRYTALLGSLGAKYTIADMVTVYANGGNSFAAPGLKSSGGTIPLSDSGVAGHDGQLPNANLKPQSGIGADIGADFKLPMGFKTGIRGFYTVMQDAIVDNVVSQTPSQTQSINAGSTTSMGLEVEASQRLNNALSWFANATYMHTTVKDTINRDNDSAQVPFSPNGVVNCGIFLSTPFGLTFSPALSYKDLMYDGTSKSGRGHFTQGVLLNVYISQRIAKGESYVVECFAQLYNITNSRFEMPWQFQDPGFSGMGGVKVTF